MSIIIFSQAQTSTSTVRGKVIDVQTKEILVGARVRIIGTNPQVETTDASGRFKFNNVPTGRQTLIVEYIGYLPVQLSNITVVKGKETVLNIQMQQSIINLKNVVVKAKVNKASPINQMATASARTFSIEETERYAGSLGDPARMAANFAGVMSVDDQRNDIIIRGNSPIGLLWRLEGVDIPNPNHFGAMGTSGGEISMLNNNVLANSDFFTGAFPAEYGNAIAGVFDLRMRVGNNQKYEFLGEVGFSGFEFGAQGPICRKHGSSFIANYRYSTLGVMNKLGIDIGTGTAVPFYQDLNFKINFPRGKFGKLSIFGIGGKNSIAMLDSKKDSAKFGFAGTDLYYRNKMAASGINYTYFLNKKMRINLKLAQTYISQQTQMDSLFHNKQYNPYLFYGASGEEYATIFAPEFFMKINTKNILKIGINLKNNKIIFHDSAFIFERNSYVVPFDLSKKYYYAQAFSEFQHRFSDELTLNLGIFSHILGINNKYSIEPRLGIKWQFANNQTFNFGSGIYSETQMPLIYFASNDHSSSAKNYSNINLDFNKSLQAVVGHNIMITNNFRIKTEIYYQYLYNIAISEQNKQFSVLNIGDDFYIPPYSDLKNNGTGRNYGIELTIEKFLTQGFYFLITSSLFESKYTPWDGIERNTKYNGNYIFNALGGYEFKLGDFSTLALDMKTVYAGGKRYTPIDLEASDSSNSIVYVWQDTYKEQYKPYFRINLRITFKENSKKHKLTQEWALDLQNLTNHKNIFQQTWNENTKSIETYYQLGFMPMMTYRILF